MNLNLSLCQQEATELSEEVRLEAELRELHASIYERTAASRSKAAELYGRAVRETQYEKGDRVLIWQPGAVLETGRKLNVPWVGPCVIEDVVGVAVKAISETTGASVKAHVNRLKKVPAGMVESAAAGSGFYPDSRRLLSAIVESAPHPRDPARTMFKIKSVGRAGYRWTDDLPDIVKRAYISARAEGPDTS
jgi:hypothetical protein